MPESSSRRVGLLERLLPVLLRIQARLDEDLSLAVLGEAAGLSPHHFHRLFRELTGETPKRYCQRLRLERAAYHLLIRRGRVLDVALDSGFRHHETFTRAFRVQFGTTPREYRRRGPRASRGPSGGVANRGGGAEELQPGFELSSTRVRELGDLPVAFIRHVGPYEDVPQESWDRLLAWAARQEWWGGAPPALLGIAHDAPSITAPANLRFDAAIHLPGTIEPALEKAPSGEIGFQTLAGGLYSETTHVGPYDTLYAAHRTAFERVERLRRYRFVGLPCVEIYRATRINKEYALNQTDLYHPVANAAI